MHVRAAAEALLAPVRDVVARGLDVLRVPGPDEVDVGEVAGFGAWRHGVLVLSSGLLGPGLHHPDEVPGPHALDRWRRAAAVVLEQAVLASLPVGGPVWLRLGVAVDRVDRALPELRLAAPELLAAAATGDLGLHPRAGVAVLRAWAAGGVDVVARVASILAGDKVELPWLMEAAAWVHGEGLRAVLPDAERAPAHDVPVTLAPWSLARIEVPAHPRGGRVVVKGRGGVAPAWAAADAPLKGVAVSGEEGCALQPDVGGPVGAWELKTAEGFGQLFGARGLQFAFRPSGRLDVTLADAFVGNLRDLDTAEKVGTSGTAVGRWRVAGAAALRLADIVPIGVTVHGRDDAPFVMPAQGFGLGEQLKAMEQATWRWRLEEGRLVLDGQIFGGRMVLRLAPVDASTLPPAP